MVEFRFQTNDKAALAELSSGIGAYAFSFSCLRTVSIMQCVEKISQYSKELSSFGKTTKEIKSFLKCVYIFSWKFLHTLYRGNYVRQSGKI